MYADWLLDRGEAQGELILIECRLEQLDPSQAEQRVALADRREALLSSDELQQWLMPVRQLALEVRTRRGFVDSVQLTAANFIVKRANALLQAAPLLTELRFHPGLVLGPEGAAKLAAIPQLRQLRNLDLSRNSLGPEGAEALCTSRYLRQLEKLILDGNNLRDRGAVALAGATGLAGLRHLSVSDNGIGLVGARAFAATRSFPSLLELCWADNPTPPAGIAALRARWGAALRLDGEQNAI